MLKRVRIQVTQRQKQPPRLTDASLRVVDGQIADWKTSQNVQSLCTTKDAGLEEFSPVNCWFPILIPVFPPLKIKSDMNPPDPFSMNMPVWPVPDAVLMLTTTSTRVVA